MRAATHEFSRRDRVSVIQLDLRETSAANVVDTMFPHVFRHNIVNVSRLENGDDVDRGIFFHPRRFMFSSENLGKNIRRFTDVELTVFKLENENSFH